MTTTTKSLLSLVIVALISPLALAGDGKYSSLFGAWDFGVSVRFDATQQQKDRMKTEFEKASALILDASDGQQEFGDIFLCNNKGGGKAAEYWILPPGTAWGSNAPGRFGVSGQHIEMYYDDMVFSNAKADGSWVLAHEWGHHAYGIKDEYSGPTAGDKECVVVPADVTQRTACLIENFWNHGADGASLTEWCVSSNHDPNHDTYQHDINGKSCWESLVENYPDVTAPAGLPDAGPGGPLLLFNWTELMEGSRFVLVIDDSGSMGSDSKMELAKLGGQIFTNLARDGHKLGVARFDSGASTAYALTVMDAGTRAAAKAAISGLNAGGGTNIDAGLTVARGLITGDGDRSCQQAIVLLSDGSQGGPVSSTLIDGLVSDGIVVHSIALGPSGVDIPTMQGVASGTGGKYFYADSGGQLPGIFAQLSAETAEGGVLNTANGTLAPGESVSEAFAVDDTTQQASFVASWDTSPGDLLVSVSSPSATYDENTVNPDVRVSVDASSVSVVVSGAAVVPGTWTVNLDPPGGLPGPPGAPQINYEVQALTDSKDLTFEAVADSGAYAYPAPMLVTATATFGSAVTGIDVAGEVRRPDGSTAEFVLRDDGSGASGDAIAGDGIYSGVFNTWGDNGSYLVALDAVNDGGGKLVGGEGLKPPGEVASVIASPDEFERHSEFSVTLTGAPVLERFGLGADKFKVSMGKTDAKNKVSVAGRINLAEDAVDPDLDTLMIRTGGLTPFSFLASELKQAGKKPRYVFKDKASGTSGFVDLFKKGSSLGKFKLSDKNFPSGFGFGTFGSLSNVPIEVTWGDMDYTATLSTKVNKKGTASSFSGKKDSYSSQELFVSSAKVSVNTKKQDKDKLSLRAKLSGVGDITGATTTIAFGPWSLEINSLDWSTNKKGTKHSFKTPDKRTTVTYDTERQELSVSSKNQSLGTITPTVQFTVTSGFLTDRREIKMSVNKKGTTFVY